MRRLAKTFRMQYKVESLLKRMPDNTPKPFREPFSVAVLASRADFGAASDGIPRRLRPLDL